MLRIALCDDEEKHLEKMNALLESYLQSRPHLNGQVELFSSGHTLLTHREKQGGFDLYILDILMPSASGIDIARRLRALGDGGEIIYLPHSNDFASDSYDVRAFFYLLKPVTERKFFQVLDEAVEKSSKRKNQAVMVHTTEGTQRILLDRIRYVERVGRCMRYYCTDGIIDSQTIRVSFQEMVTPLLADRRFCLCGASFALNFQYVIGVNGQTALLDNGQTVTLPRAAASEFKKAWGNYWLEEGTVW